MFAKSLALMAGGIALASCAVSVPLQRAPRQIDRPVASVGSAGSAFAAACKDWDDWDKPAPPVRIHGNSYLVGTCGIAAILIAGNQGHILIDGGTEKGAELIAANIEKLGFDLRDVKYLLHSHEHFDHVGGIARLQQLAGAQLLASPEAAAVLNTGLAGAADPQAGMHAPFAAAQVGRVVADAEMVRLGNLALTAVATPGHTAGALTWHWGSCDGGVCRRIVYADSLTAISRDDYRFSDHPSYVTGFRNGLQRLASLECDILLTPHPSASALLRRLSGAAPLVDPTACRDYAAALGKRLDERLAKEAPVR